MTDRIETMSLREARRDSASQQSRLASFGDDSGDDGETTYVGVVRSDSDEYMSVVDETEERLAPPSDLFHQWLTTKRTMQDEGMLETTAHNQALDAVGYMPRYEEYLREDPDAQLALQSLVARLNRGEDIVLVCYCHGEQNCHTSKIVDLIDERL